MVFERQEVFMWLVKNAIELGEGKTTVKIGNKIPPNVAFHTQVFFFKCLGFSLHLE